MFHLTTISKKLTLSPRPRRKLERQKKAISIHEESFSSEESPLPSPKGPPQSGGTWLSTAAPPSFSQSVDTHDKSRTRECGGRDHSFDGSQIQIVVDRASPETPQRRPMRATYSDPINPKLLTVHGMVPIDFAPDDLKGTNRHLSPRSLLSPLSLPTTPLASPPDSPSGSPSFFRRRGSWKDKRSNSSPGSKRTPKMRQSNSFSGLLRGKKTAKFSLDPDMMDPERTYWIITIHEFSAGSEFEVQRIPNYEQYLSSILAETDPSHPDYEDLSKAVNKVRNMVKERKEELHVVENEHKVGGVQDRFPNDDLHLQEQYVPSKKSLQNRRKSAPGGLLLRSLKVKHSSSSSDLSKAGSVLPDSATRHNPSIAASPNRTYALEGPVNLSAGVQNQDRYLFLFNDLLLVAKQKSSMTFKLKYRVRVCEMWTSDCLEQVSENSTLRDEEKSFVVGWPTVNYVATFENTETKQRWLSKLRESITAEKEREEPKTIMLRVLNRDVDNDGIQYKSMPVRNTEDASSLGRRCADQFNLTKGPDNEYKLWVRTGKDDPPYPLIGHEHPYSIKMNRVRDTARADGAETPVILDQDLNDNDVQFILRENKKMTKKSSFDENQKKKSVKAKKSPLSFFKKRNRDPSPSPAPTGKLFGRPLAEVCEENEIPKPLHDMLYYLFVHGPFTSGIFRKPANHKNVVELREKLDAGEEFCVDDVNPIVIASVLKEYLRTLPDCLLLRELYPMWVETVEMDNMNERFNNTKHVCLRLPSANVNLLRHLMCVLYHIQQRSTENSMNAYNLAVCISQSLLWTSQTVEGQELTQHSESMAKIPKVVEYMVSNCVELFGEECIKIFGDAPSNKQRGDSSTDSDSINSILGPGYPQTANRRDDSSIDSLEHAFLTDHGDIEAVSPGPGESKHLSPTNFSCDSGLFSSDTQLYDENAENSGDVSISSRRGLHRSAPVSRAVSHESHESQSPTQGHFSESYDSAIDMSSSQSSVPRAAPRKTKRQADITVTHTKPVQRMPTVHSGVELRTQTLPHIQSDTGLSELKNVRSVPKRASGDSNLGSSLGSSLGSVEESSDEFLELQSRHRSETNILRKSESGAKLYIDESLLHGAMYIDPTHSAVNFADLHSPDRPVSYHGIGAHMGKKKTTRSMSPPTSRHSWGGQLEPSGGRKNSARFSLSPSHSLDDLNEEIEDSRDMSKSISALSNDSTLTDNNPVPSVLVTPSHSTQNEENSSQRQSPQKSAKEPQVSNRISRKAPLLKELKSKSMDAFPSDNLPNKELGHQIKHSPRHVDKVTLRKHLKGMTATGGDLFPKEMQRKLAGHKAAPSQQYLQVMHNESRDRSADTVYAENRHAAKASVHSPQGAGGLLSKKSNSVDTHDRQGSRSAQLVRQVALEKSASDPRVGCQGRPHEPPSYQEAIRRKQQLSDAEIEEQKKKSAMARRLHEKSQKMYAQEQRRIKEAYYSEPERSRDNTPVYSKERAHKPLPTYEQAVKRAEELKEQRQGLPPAYSKPPSNPNDNPGRDPSLSGQSRRRSKSRERGQRLSDTRLESRRKRKTNLSRSKSDSSEHLNKLSNLKHTYSSSTDTDDDRPVVLRSRRLGKSLSKERLNHDTASPRSLSKSAERPKSCDYSRMLKQLQDQGLDIIDDGADKNLRTRRKSWTVKHRDWHKELADKYTGHSGPVPSHDSRHHAKPIFTYRGAVPTTEPESHDADTEDGEKPKRRWVPPVHPSKDLIMCNGEESERGKKDYMTNHVHRSSSHATALKQKNSYTPTHVLLEAQRQQSEQGKTENARVQNCNTQCRNSDSPPSSTSDQEDSDADVEAGRLTWSVSKLRGLYDANPASESPRPEVSASPDGAFPLRTAAPRPAPRAVNGMKHAQHPHTQPLPAVRQKDCIIITKEYTNPHSEKQYL